VDICFLDNHKQALTYDYIVRGVAHIQKELCDRVGLPYVEEEAIQNAIADAVVHTMSMHSTGTQHLSLDEIPLCFESSLFFESVAKSFADYEEGSESLVQSNFPYESLFTPKETKYRYMGMTDGGRVRVRYTVKRPKEAVRPGNIPNETRMTMANYENEIGFVPLRGRVKNPEHIRVANEIINDPDYNAQPESVPIGQLDDWLTVRRTCGKLKKFDAFTSYYDNIHNVEVYDSFLPGWTKLRKWMKCTNPNLEWYRIKTSTGVNRLFTYDHPLPIQVDGQFERVQMVEIIPGMTMLGCKTDRKTGARRAITIEVAEHKAVTHDLIPPSGYDLETDSDHFDIDTIVTHNCRTTSLP